MHLTTVISTFAISIFWLGLGSAVAFAGGAEPRIISVSLPSETSAEKAVLNITVYNLYTDYNEFYGVVEYGGPGWNGQEAAYSSPYGTEIYYRDCTNQKCKFWLKGMLAPQGLVSFDTWIGTNTAGGTVGVRAVFIATDQVGDYEFRRELTVQPRSQPTPTSTPILRPTITSVEPMVAAPGQWVTVRGENFLVPNTDVSSLSVAVHSNFIASVTSKWSTNQQIDWEQNEIRFRIPDNYPDVTGPLYVFVNNQFASWWSFRVARNPTPTPTLVPTITPTPTPSGSVVVSVSPAAAEVAEGSTTTLNVVANVSGTDLGAWMVELAYNPSIVVPTTCSGSIGLSICNRTYSEHSVYFAGAVTSAVVNPTTLGTVTFKGLSGGSSALHLGIRQAAGISGAPLSSSAVDGTITVSPSATAPSQLVPVTTSVPATSIPTPIWTPTVVPTNTATPAQLTWTPTPRPTDTPTPQPTATTIPSTPTLVPTSTPVTPTPIPTTVAQKGSVSISMPEKVKTGQSFDLEVRVTNPYDKEIEFNSRVWYGGIGWGGTINVPSVTVGSITYHGNMCTPQSGCARLWGGKIPAKGSATFNVKTNTGSTTGEFVDFAKVTAILATPEGDAKISHKLTVEVGP